MGQIEQTWSSSSPQLKNVCVLDVPSVRPGWCGQWKSSTDSLFHHFPEHHRRTFPPTAQPGPLLYQTERAHYYCARVPRTADLGHAAATSSGITDFWRPVLCLSVPCSLLLRRPSHHYTKLWWQQHSRKGANPSHPGLLLHSAGITRARLCKHSSSELLLVTALFWQKATLGCVSPSPMGLSNCLPGSYLCLCLMFVFKSEEGKIWLRIEF